MEALEPKVLTQYKGVDAAEPMIRVVMGHASDTSSSRRIEDFFGSVTPDNHAADAKGILFAIADGLSGGAGRAAAESIVYSVLSDFYATAPGTSPNNALNAVIAAINRWLFAQNSHAGVDAGMLTTLSVLLLCGRRYHIAHVGDTRVYVFRDGRLRKLTSDHVWRAGGGQRILRRAVGLDAQVLIDFVDDELATGETFLMLTDGVWETVTETEMATCISEQSNPQRLAEMLVERAILRGSQIEINDATAAVIRIEAAPG